jgi:hypothetical protein
VNRNVRALRRAAEEVRPLVAPPIWDRLDAAIKKLEPRRSAPKHLAPGVSKDARRIERGIRLKVAREMVMIRADGRCELCGRSGYVLEAHHMISGPLRRVKESAETMIAVCADCHRAQTRGDEDALKNAKEVAIRLGMREALAALDRRLDKIAEARASRRTA